MGMARGRQCRQHGWYHDLRQCFLVSAALVLFSSGLCRRHRCVLTVGSLVGVCTQGFPAADASEADAANSPGDPRAAKTERATGNQREGGTGVENEAQYDGDAALLAANVPRQDLPAYRVLVAGIELYVRGYDMYRRMAKSSVTRLGRDQNDIKESGDFNGSLALYLQAIDLKHNLPLAWLNLGLAFTALDREEDAIAAYKRVVELPNALPSNVASAYCNHGHLVQTRAGVDCALLEEGLALFRRGLEQVPDQPSCLYNLALGLEKCARFMEARGLYQRAITEDPSMGNAHLNLGNIAFRAGDWTEGISRYESAYSSPDADQRLRTVTSFMLGQVYRHGIGDVSTAVEFYKRSYAIDNTYNEALSCVLQSLRVMCLWDGWDTLDPHVASVIAADIALEREPGPQSSYETCLTGELKPSQHLGLARLASKRYDRVVRLPLEEREPRTFRWSPGKETLGPEKGRGRNDFDGWAREEEFGVLGEGTLTVERSEERTGLVVAYWSFDYRDHPMGHLTRGLLCTHQAYDRIFAMAASYGADDGSSVRRSAETCAGKFLDVSHLADVQAAQAVVEEGPDIFVDLMAHTTGARYGIPAMRPAPIMASYLGYPGTVGGEYIDYTIADSTVVPPELAGLGFSEKLVYLPHSYQANDYNVSHNFCGGGEDLGECQASARSSRGLDDFLERSWGKGPVLCNYNSIHKMEPESFTVFLDILRRVPGSVLLLLTSSHHNGGGVEFNLKAEAAARGVHPERIMLDKKLPRAEHIWRISGSCDLFIDSFFYGAHTTAADALWAGLPLLTLRGYGLDETPVGKMPGRVGTSLLSTLGMPELSFHSVKELEDAAVALAKSPRRLAVLRKRLLSASMNSPLFDTPLITRNLERAYEAMWEVRAMGLSPKHIVVDPTQNAESLLKLGCEFEDGDGWGDSVVTHERAVGISAAKRTSKSTSNMASRATEATVAWEEGGTRDGAEAALAATARLLAGDPLSISGMHLRGVAFHLLGRSEEAAALMETVALLATARKHEQPDLDLTLLWSNLEVMQLAIAKAGGQPYPPATATFPYLKGLALRPSEPALVLILLKAYQRMGDCTTCANAFWTYWPAIRSQHPTTGRAETAGGEVAEGGVSMEAFGGAWAWSAWLGGDASTVAAIVHTAASCFAKLDRFEEAWRAWRFAAELQPTNQLFPMQFAVALRRAGYVTEADDALKHILKRLNHVWFHLEGGSKVSRWLRPGGVDGQKPPTVVAFYCFEYGNAWFPNWGPSSLGKGLGGSEEVVIHLSRELARLGFWVEVYADPIGPDVGRDRGGGTVEGGGGVVWYPHTAYDVSHPPDVFVAWRYHVSLHLAEGSYRRFLWLQDVLEDPLPSFVEDAVDAIFCPSLYHVSLIQPAPLQALGRELPNGIDSGIYKDGENRPDTFVYGSAPNRGLRAVLMAWSYIKTEIPGATLEIYYGFSPNFMEWGKKHIHFFDEWMAGMTQLLNQEGVLYKGMVDHNTLHDAYARAGFVLYPTAFPETGCVSLIKAMAMGAVPITSRFPTSTLPELTTEWDMGPAEALPGNATLAEHDLLWLESWAIAVVRASKRDSSERAERQKQSFFERDQPRHHPDEANSAHAGTQATGLPQDKNPFASTVKPAGTYRGGEYYDGQGNLVDGSVQALRRAMKSTVREKYAFSKTAKLWAIEIDPGSYNRRSSGGDDS